MKHWNYYQETNREWVITEDDQGCTIRVIATVVCEEDAILIVNADRYKRERDGAVELLLMCTGGFEALESTGISAHLPGFNRERQRLRAFLARIEQANKNKPLT